MLNRLLLMRHAKSSWSDASLSDHERTLNERGMRAAVAVGQALHARGFAPEFIWSSDAARTRLTALRLIRSMPGAQQIEYIPEFYHASAVNVLQICEARAEPDKPLMLLGHNPGWGALHEYFTSTSHPFPTGACTVLERDNDGHWLSASSWAFKDLILPRDLE